MKLTSGNAGRAMATGAHSRTMARDVTDGRSQLNVVFSDARASQRRP
jgi:hypothetical protein